MKLPKEFSFNLMSKNIKVKAEDCSQAFTGSQLSMHELKSVSLSLLPILTAMAHNCQAGKFGLDLLKTLSATVMKVTEGDVLQM